MKTIHLLMLAALAASMPARASETTDTVAVVKCPTVITVMTTETTNSISIVGSEGNPQFRLNYTSQTNAANESAPESLWAFNSRFTKRPGSKKGRRRNPLADGVCDFYAGALITSDADPGINSTGWEIGMLNVAKLQWQLSQGGTDLSVGIGWDYRHLTINGGFMAVRNADGAYVLVPIPEGQTNTKSTLRNFAVQFPVLLSQRLAGRFTFEAGAAAMLNTYTTGNSSWRTDNTKSKASLKNLHQRILSVDILARIGWRNRFAFYFRYSPVALFKSDFGPQYRSFSVGASLGF